MAVVYTLPDYPFTDFPAGSRVLDIGFGKGNQMRELRDRGCRPFGIDVHIERIAHAHIGGLAVCRASANALPFTDACFDGLICRGVLPFTDELVAIREMARVLRPGALARLVTHGVGYPLHMATERSWERRTHALRVLVNTPLYVLTGWRLPGFLGKTIYQSRARLRRCYDRAGLELLDDRPAPRFLGSPVFLYHTVRKPSA